jgi:hypothetical protein
VLKINFFLRYQSQLRLTRESVFKKIEMGIINAMEVSGGVVRSEKKIIQAVFDESKLGFDLAVLIFLEKAIALMEELARDTFGYCIVIRQNSDDEDTMRLCTSLHSGIWFDADYAEQFQAFAVFGADAAGLKKLISLKSNDWPWSAETFPGSLWELFYCFELMKKFYPERSFQSLFTSAGMNSEIVSRSRNFFMARALSFSEEECINALGKRASPVRTFVASLILASLNKKEVKPSYHIIAALHRLECDAGDELILNAVLNDARSGNCEEMQMAINDRNLFSKENFASVVGKERAKDLAYIFYTNKALYHGSESEIRAAFLEPPPESNTNLLYRTQILADIASYHISTGNNEEAGKSLKEAMLIAQEPAYEKEMPQAQRLYALVNIRNFRLRDAIDYLNFAIEKAEKLNNSHEIGLISYYSAATNYLYGNISGAKRSITTAIEAARLAGKDDWATRFKFFEARLLFETGFYAESYDGFQALKDTDAVQSDLIDSWSYRSEIYMGKIYPRVPGTLHNDGYLFQIEDAYFHKSYEEAFNYSENLIHNITGSEFSLIEQPDWRSGFAQCELLVQPYNRFIYNMVSAYRALSLAKIGKANNDAAYFEKANDSIRPCLKNNVQTSDVLDAFFYFANYCILKDSGAPEVDANTAISIAFKRLQGRSSRIDDSETKRRFSNQNYWNKQIWEAARKHKLV